MDIILKIPDEATLLAVDWWNLSRSHQEGATVTHPYDGETIDLTDEEEPEEAPKVYCKDCAKRHNGCPLQVWCGPLDDDYCSRGVPKE